MVSLYFYTMIRRLIVLCCLMLYSCIVVADGEVRRDTLSLFDRSRSRLIPVEYSLPASGIRLNGVVVFSHGYNQNQPGSYLDYTWLKKYLTDRGYAIVSIQHELPDDSLLSKELPAKVTRWSNWKRGEANILYVIEHMVEVHQALQRKKYIMMGHSNGGDMSALFATDYPQYCERLITLDNRRMTLPVQKKFGVASIRSSDQPADEGVIPDELTQRKYHMLIVKATGVIHNHMGDSGDSGERAEMMRLMDQILKSHE